MTALAVVTAASCGLSRKPSVALVDGAIKEDGVMLPVVRVRGGGLQLGPYAITEITVEEGNGPGPAFSTDAPRPSQHFDLRFRLTGPERSWNAACEGTRRASVDADYAAAASDPRDDVVVRCRVRDQADAGWELAAEGHLGRNFGGTITSDGGAPHKLEVLLRFQLWRFFDRRLPAPVGQIRDDKRVIAAMLLARPEKIWLAKDVAPREQEAALALLAGLRLLPIGLDVG
ncbi:MAG: hypothetical protein R3A51_19285 [Nannocystaceae bacterium]|nr:hypothetical protein [Myxococcales bacterium]